MILEFNQIGRQPNPFFEGKINGQVVITGKGATRLNNGFIFIDFAGNEYQISNILQKPTKKRRQVNADAFIFCL